MAISSLTLPRFAFTGLVTEASRTVLRPHCDSFPIMSLLSYVAIIHFPPSYSTWNLHNMLAILPPSLPPITKLHYQTILSLAIHSIFNNQRCTSQSPSPSPPSFSSRRKPPNHLTFLAPQPETEPLLAAATPSLKSRAVSI
jgi:hypothetical protein